MRLSVFRAPTMAQAMAALRRELGDDAVLLDTRSGRGGVEITAAIPPDEDDDEPWLANVPAVPADNRPRDNQLGPLPEDAPLFLIGTPGAGKTMTCVKLATRHVLAGRQPLVVTTDGERAGAVEQLGACMRALGLALAVAGSRTALVRALENAVPGQPVLVDTAGCNPFDDARVRALLGLIHGLGHPVLVQPGGLCPEEAEEEARAFHAMGARHLLPTRMDVARRGGSVLAAARAGLTLTEAGTGPDPANDLVRITPDWVATRLQGRSA
ncbi:flagellar biosynthesis protein FlhF [Rhodovarius crocodyli]|nr:GTPase [Rhodovarius crocodyli]